MRLIYDVNIKPYRICESYNMHCFSVDVTLRR